MREDVLLERLKAYHAQNDTVTVKFKYKKKEGELSKTLLEPGDFYGNTLTYDGITKIKGMIKEVIAYVSKKKVRDDAIVITSTVIHHKNIFN